MKYREFTCLYCGEKGIDMSKNQRRKFCDVNCSSAYGRRQNGMKARIKTLSCIYNREIRCEIQKYGICGWNPKVEKKRKEALWHG